MNKQLVKSPAQGYLPALDGIRGLAILMVLCVHFFMIFTPSNTFERLLQSISGHGTLGIDLFFLLSGFLITGILLDTREKSAYFKNFFIRRLLRIFPLYYLVLAIIFGTLSFLPSDQQLPYAKMFEAQPWAWSYLFNFFIAREGAWTVPYIGHFWSLAVEEQFYMVWPFLVFYLSPTRLLQACIVIILLSTGCHMVLEMQDVSAVSIHVLTPCRLNALCLGALLATMLRDQRILAHGIPWLKRQAWLLVGLSFGIKLLILAIVAIKPETSKALEAFRTLSWLGLFSSLHLGAVLAPSASPLIRALSFRPLSFLGQYSYGIYIFHHFLSWPSEHYGSIAWLTHTLGHQSLAVLVNALVGVSMSIGMAWLSFHLYEKHFLKLKDVLAPPSR